jgi:hypothetical protein
LSGREQHVDQHHAGGQEQNHQDGGDKVLEQEFRHSFKKFSRHPSLVQLLRPFHEPASLSNNRALPFPSDRLPGLMFIFNRVSFKQHLQDALPVPKLKAKKIDKLNS